MAFQEGTPAPSLPSAPSPHKDFLKEAQVVSFFLLVCPAWGGAVIRALYPPQAHRLTPAAET